MSLSVNDFTMSPLFSLFILLAGQIKLDSAVLLNNDPIHVYSTVTICWLTWHTLVPRGYLNFS